jgi:hypothetical protein
VGGTGHLRLFVAAEFKMNNSPNGGDGILLLLLLREMMARLSGQSDDLSNGLNSEDEDFSDAREYLGQFTLKGKL